MANHSFERIDHRRRWRVFSQPDIPAMDQRGC